MKAIVLTDPFVINYTEVEKPEPKSGEVLVKLYAAALNHRDQWIREGKYPGIKVGTILGSDGAGIVENAGEGVDRSWVGKKVLINPNREWGNNPEVQSVAYNILGMPANGTLAEYVSVPVDRLHEIPSYLSLAAAAALPLGGLTAYRAVYKHGKVKKGDHVLVNGIGGGVAQFAFLFSLAAGAKVWITSGSEEKLAAALGRGGEGGFIYKEKDWHKKAKELTKGFDLIIDSAGGDQLNDLIDVLRPAGKIVFYGATTGLPSKLNLHKLFWLQGSLQGSTMGNDEEFAEMIRLCREHQIMPIMEEPIALDNAVEAFDKMKEGKQFGKLVIRIHEEEA